MASYREICQLAAQNAAALIRVMDLEAFYGPIAENASQENMQMMERAKSQIASVIETFYDR